MKKPCIVCGGTSFEATKTKNIIPGVTYCGRCGSVWEEKEKGEKLCLTQKLQRFGMWLLRKIKSFTVKTVAQET